MANYVVKNGKIKGTSRKDKIAWRGQSDWRRALTVKAGKGNDVINFAASGFNKNKLYGDAGNDKILGGSKIDYIYGGAGNDKLFGNSGNDQIHAGAGNDIIDGGKHSDKIWCDSGCNAVLGGVGNDTIYAGTGYDAIDGGDGRDVIYLSKAGENLADKTLKLGKKTIKLDKNKRTYVLGGKGNDKILDAQGGAVIYGGEGKDTITAISGKNTIYGGEGDDSITCSSSEGNKIYGEDGSDIIKSGAGNDYIEGGAGRDNISSGAGNDTIYGGASNDTINAGAGNNTIYFKRGEGTDDIINGGGNDLLVFLDDDFSTLTGWREKGTDNLILKGSDGTKSVYARLKGYYSEGGHSAKQVQLKDGTYDIKAIAGVPSSEPLALAPASAKMMSVESIVADVAAWQGQSSGLSDITSFVQGGKDINILAAVPTGYENAQPVI